MFRIYTKFTLEFTWLLNIERNVAYLQCMEDKVRNFKLPRVFVPIGGYVVHGGYRYRCIQRPPEKGLHPDEACSGCDISRKYRSCGGLQCSRYDREDGCNVWFVED